MEIWARETLEGDAAGGRKSLWTIELVAVGERRLEVGERSVSFGGEANLEGVETGN